PFDSATARMMAGLSAASASRGASKLSTSATITLSAAYATRAAAMTAIQIPRVRSAELTFGYQATRRLLRQGTTRATKPADAPLRAQRVACSERGRARHRCGRPRG